MTAKARIYQPSKTAMQSGRAKTRQWLLEFMPSSAMTPEPLMGWNSAKDTLSQIRLKFATQEEAEAYATAHNIAYSVVQPKARQTKPKAYADNFAAKRQLPF